MYVHGHSGSQVFLRDCYQVGAENLVNMEILCRYRELSLKLCTIQPVGKCTKLQAATSHLDSNWTPGMGCCTEN